MKSCLPPYPYQKLKPSPFKTAFWEFYKKFTDIEARFNLIYRRDGDVAIWTANRVRHYYDFASQIGLYNSQETEAELSASSEAYPLMLFPDSVDIIVQSGAGGPTTANRTRAYGCIYTSNFVKRRLDLRQRVLIVHDAPETLKEHPNLFPVPVKQFRIWGQELGKKVKASEHVLTPQAENFWGEVNLALFDELGVEGPNFQKIATQVRQHKQAVNDHGALLDRLKPSVSVMMTHYFRAPQIEAAQKRKIWTVDYQHGIHSKYHMGYGYPGLKPQTRAIPYLPDEHWQWGHAWTSDDWWPKPLKRRVIGLDATQNSNDVLTPFEMRPDKVLLIASSWAMREDYIAIIQSLARKSPEWTFRIKLHPREKLKHYTVLSEEFSNVELIAGDKDIHDAAKEVRYVASICSSSLFDVLLDGCRIAVLNLPSVEYGEDFTEKYGVPVLDLDGSNFTTIVEALDLQNLPKEDLFYSIGSVERRLLDESLSVSVKMLAPPPLSEERRKHLTLGLLYLRFIAPTTLRLLHLKTSRETRAVIELEKQRLIFSPKQYVRVLKNRFEFKRKDALGLNGKMYLLSAAIADSIPAAYLADLIREVLKLGDDQSLKARAVLLKKIFASVDIASAPLRAELLEKFIFLNPVNSTQFPWKKGVTALSNLCSGGGTLAGRYEVIISSAKSSYPDTKLLSTQITKLTDKIVESLSKPEPFSMINMGCQDTFWFNADYAGLDEIKSYNQKSEDRLRANLRKSNDLGQLREFTKGGLLNADFIGIPSIWQLLQVFPKELGELRGPTSHWPELVRHHQILSEEIEKLTADGSLDWTTKIVVDNECPQILFSKETIGQFLQSNRPTVLVSCLNHKEVTMAFGKSIFDKIIQMPNVSKSQDGLLTEAVKVHPSEDILTQIDEFGKNRAVFFIANSIESRILIDRAKRSGGVGLDIGNAADYWA